MRLVCVGLPENLKITTVETKGQFFEHAALSYC